MSMKEQRKVVTAESLLTHKKIILKTLSSVLAAAIVGGSIPTKVMATNINTEVTLSSSLEGESNPAIEDEPEVTPELSQEPTATPTPTPLPTQVPNPVSLGPKIKYGSLSKANKVKTVNKAFLGDLTEGKIKAIANASERIYPSELSELISILVILDRGNLSDNVTISRAATKVSGTNVMKFGFKEGDTISVENLLYCYLLTRSDDARYALVEHIAGNEDTFVTYMNQMAKSLNVTSTKFITSDGNYSSKQYSMVHDMYLIVYKLLQNNWFANAMGTSKVSISYVSKSGSEVKQTCNDNMLSKFGKVKVPEGYTNVAQFTSSDDNAKGNQLVILKDDKGSYYVSLLAQVGLDKNISKESAKFIRVLVGDAYSDEVKTETPVEEGTEETTNPEISPTPTPIPLDIPTKDNNARYQYLFGSNYKAYTMDNPPKGYRNATEAMKNMTTITVPVWKMSSNGGRYASTMQLTIHKKLAKSVAQIFNQIYALDIKFPIKTMVGYSYRKVGGVGLSNSRLMSIHTFGAAIDINPGDYDNDYFLGAGNDLRDKTNPYCIPDEVIEIFERNGWFWGGNFSICSDTMHFQYLGLEFLSYQGNHPFRTLKVNGNTTMKGSDVKNLQQRLKELGFKISVDGVYGKSTESVIKKAQKKYGLEVTGVVDYKTWETIVNLTHYMSYVF